MPGILLIACGGTRVSFVVNKMHDLIYVLLVKSVNKTLLIKVVNRALYKFFAILKSDCRCESSVCGIMPWMVGFKVACGFVTTKI